MSSKSSNILTKWKIDFVGKSRSNEIGGGGPSSSTVSRTSSIASDTSLNPPGFVSSVGHYQEVGSPEDDHRLLAKRSWEMALVPLKQVPMNLFIMYMAGNSISIFPIMMVGMMFFRPLKALLSISSMFASMEEPGRSLLGQKLVFLLGNLIAVGLALYKCSSMGLLPTHQSDWLAFVAPQTRTEFANGGHTFL